MITKITKKWIAQNKPCKEAIDLWDKKTRNPIKILKWLMEIEKYDWAKWFIVRVMEYKQYVSYAVFAAEQVIGVYEKQYPEDKRPRETIEAAKRCIDNPNNKNKEAACAAYAVAYAAANAAYAAANAAAAYAVDAAMLKKILDYGIKLLEKEE